MKYLSSLILAGIAAVPSAEAAGFFVGTETVRTHSDVRSATGELNKASVVDGSFAGKIYFVFDPASRCCVEVRVQDKQYYVRPAYKVIVVERTNSSGVKSGSGGVVTGNVYASFSLRDATKSTTANGTSVGIVDWVGNKKYLAAASQTDPTTGWYKGYPDTFTSIQTFDSVQENGTKTQSWRRVNSSVKIIAPLTKESNAANDTWSAAVQRLKEWLNARGHTETNVAM